MKLNKPEESIEEHSDFSERLEEEYFTRSLSFTSVIDNMKLFTDLDLCCQGSRIKIAVMT
jgi:hypothetical protein